MSEQSIMRIPISLPCQVPVFPGTPSTAEPIEQRTECCAVDGWWMIGRAIICDWHLREMLVDGYEATIEQWPDFELNDREQGPWESRHRYEQSACGLFEGHPNYVG